MDEGNPLIPGVYDIAWSVPTTIIIVLTVVALVMLAPAARRLAMTHALIWALLILFVPVLGAVTWLAIGRRTDTSASRSEP